MFLTANKQDTIFSFTLLYGQVELSVHSFLNIKILDNNSVLTNTAVKKSKNLHLCYLCPQAST